jgi:hypothetical protein
MQSDTLVRAARRMHVTPVCDVDFTTEELSTLKFALDRAMRVINDDDHLERVRHVRERIVEQVDPMGEEEPSSRPSIDDRVL